MSIAVRRDTLDRRVQNEHNVILYVQQAGRSRSGMSATQAVSLAEFEAIFESVKNWGRWGEDDELGTLNYVTPEKVREAAALVRSGRRVSMAIPINKVAGPDNPMQATLLVVQAHDVPVDGSGVG